MQHIIGMILLAALFQTQLTAADLRTERRTSVRAALANKLDPNFWPSRGRRSSASPYKHSLKLYIHPEMDNIQPRQTSDEDGPFWANRGRSISDMDHFLAALNQEKNHEVSSNKARSIESDGPFWVNRGRATEDEGPFWANRGRSTDDGAGPFWANRGRAVESLASSEDGPFWANRGRREEGESFDERLRRDILFAEEPGYISLTPDNTDQNPNTRRSLFPDSPAQDADMFWVARGKKAYRRKRELGVFYPKDYPDFRDRHDKMNRALEQLKDAHFGPSRGKGVHNFRIPYKCESNRKLESSGKHVTHTRTELNEI